jgi:hypothetical protein
MMLAGDKRGDAATVATTQIAYCGSGCCFDDVARQQPPFDFAQGNDPSTWLKVTTFYVARRDDGFSSSRNAALPILFLRKAGGAR